MLLLFLCLLILLVYYIVSRYAIIYYIVNIYWPLPAEHEWNKLSHQFRREALSAYMVPLVGEFLVSVFIASTLSNWLMERIITQVKTNG